MPCCDRQQLNRDVKIGLFAMGGTIAMTVGHDAAGAAPGVDATGLLEKCPGQSGISITPHDVFLKPSASVGLTDIALLADVIESYFLAGDDGAVVTTGTDTLAEVAFALSLMKEWTKPLIVTGAMRSFDKPGADGPANLGAALQVARCAEACSHGPLVVIDDEIHAADLVQKVHTSRTHAFSSAPFGPVGHVTETNVRFVLRARRHSIRLRPNGPIPPVPILQAGMDLEPETIDAIACSKLTGLVIAGAGGGHVSERAAHAIQDLAASIPVILASHVAMGETLQATYSYPGSEIDLARKGVINGGRWRPTQARILLQLLISNGASRDQIALTLATRHGW